MSLALFATEGPPAIPSAIPSTPRGRRLYRAQAILEVGNATLRLQIGAGVGGSVAPLQAEALPLSTSCIPPQGT
jgi:hypothetical protein